MLLPQGRPRGSRPWRNKGKATEAVKNWKPTRRGRCSRQEPSGVWDVECRDSTARNWRDPPRSGSEETISNREGVGAGHSTAGRQETTQLRSREGPAVGLSFRKEFRSVSVPGTN